jgi:hypothetical protein
MSRTGNHENNGQSVPKALDFSGIIYPLTGTGVIGDVLTLTAPGVITLQPNGSGTGSVTSVGLAAPPSEFSVSGSPVTSAGTLTLIKQVQAANTLWAGPTLGAPAQPSFRPLSSADLPAGTGTVTSVAQTVPAEFAITGSPITTTGTLAITKQTQNPNYVWAGPTTGPVAQPTFRALVTGDLPAGTGTVTSVAQTVPAEFIITGSPITTTGTLAITKATQAANLVWAGPTTGAAATPTFRSLVAADIPAGTGIQTLAQVLATGNTTGANNIIVASPQTIDFTGGMKLTGSFIKGNDSKNVIEIVDTPGSDSYLQVSGLTGGVFLYPEGTPADVSMSIFSKGAAGIGLLPGNAGQIVRVGSYFTTDFQICSGAGRFNPDPPVLVGPGNSRLVFASSFFDRRPTGYAAMVNLGTSALDVGYFASANNIWMVTAQVEGQQNPAVHAGNNRLELHLKYNNNGTIFTMGKVRMDWPATETTFVGTTSSLIVANNVGPQEFFCDFVNTSVNTVQVDTYRLQACLLK